MSLIDQSTFSRLRAGPDTLPALALGLLVSLTLLTIWIAVANPIQSMPAPPLERGSVVIVALVAAALAVLVGAVVIAATVARRSGSSVTTRVARNPIAGSWALLSVRTYIVSTLTGLLAVLSAAAIGLPSWACVLVALAVLAPVYLYEWVWQYKQYSVFAIYTALVALQLGHVGEHVAQMTQLVTTHGNLALSKGVFGALNIETVHFAFVVGLWLGSAWLVFNFGLSNRWLLASFLIASFHSVEHFYIYWIYLTAPHIYFAGGQAGIFGAGGLVGSPLARQYLHFLYNVYQFMPFAVGYVVQAQRIANARVPLPRQRSTLVAPA